MQHRKLTPALTRFVTSPARRIVMRQVAELRRRIARQPHAIHYFHRVDDPYCQLMLQALPELQQRFDVTLIPHVIEQLQPQMYPAPDLLSAYSAIDAKRLARLYRLPFPQIAPGATSGEREKASRALVARTRSPRFFAEALDIGTAFWSGASVAESAQPARDTSALRAGEALLEKLGHYASATVFYGGEWYWGLDRLDHLERRLLSLGLGKNPNESVHYDRTWRGLFEPVGEPIARQTPLEYFFSARIPYSYLGFFQAQKFAAAHGLDLELKPVLPMVMRGMAVPQAKRIYILTDSKREAEKFGLEFGRIVDPLGPGIERAYAVAHWAHAAGQSEAFFASLLPAIAAEAIDVASDSGLRKVVARAGLDWRSATQALTGKRWRDWVTGHRSEMTELGLWGVPCLKYGNTVAWGQDRFWVIREALTGGPEPSRQA